MNVRVKLAVGVAVIAAGAVGGTAALAGGGGGKEFNERLTGYEETPLALSTPGNGKFQARIRADRGEVKYKLRWADLEGPVTQAHIHFGARAQTGGISAFLCTNLGNSPTAQACPTTNPATIEGTIRSADVIGPAGQGIAGGEFVELVRAMKAGATYVNVHTEKYPGGEIRAQLEKRGRHRGGKH